MSIGGESADRTIVEKALGRAQTNLGQVAHPENLGSDDRAAYNQALSLLTAAQQAEKQGDYLAASSLAQKAAILSDRFNGYATP
ncbi:MAG TPA: hypothetical protein VMF50_00775 [Candidatus Binataceae bacterium]|nr:hypothetical protein [Candidatus Binataceae bacterium]